MDWVGGKWLVEKYQIKLAQRLRVESLIRKSRKTSSSEGFTAQEFPEGFRPAETLAGQLTFMFKHEEMHFELLSRLFDAIDHTELEEWIKSESTGAYARRAGFFFEWFTDRHLNVDDLSQGNYIDAIDSSAYFSAPHPASVKRWRVRNNLPGTRYFCPLINITDKVQAAQDYDCAAALTGLETQFGAELLLKSSVWLTIKESRASFEIEHEENREDRIKRFAVVMESRCGELANPLSLLDLESLQAEILGENALAYGVRQSPVFVGHSVGYREVLDYIAPHWENAPAMLGGLSDTLSITQGASPIVRATIASFGFVYIHPMADGNGRISRFLVNDILRRDGAVPKPFILPISATITHSTTARVGYDQSLEAFSKDLMKAYAEHFSFGKSETYGDGIESNFHFSAYDHALAAWRYPNLTSQVEYMGNVIRQTIEEEMLNEALYMRNIHRARRAVKRIIEGPDATIDRIISSIWTNKAVSNKLRKQFSIFEDEEKSSKIVQVVLQAFRTDPEEGLFDDEDGDEDSDKDNESLVYRR
ncbi:Fic family protein [Undibacterium sp. Ji49W]|uniref:Fic family protein n=1 Tax=Undibacterium sp. Ji49W TaxID=3413040 RepID=UPI003BF06981